MMWLKFILIFGCISYGFCTNCDSYSHLEYGSNCYYLGFTAGVPFAQGEALCQSNSTRTTAHLASIHDAFTNAVIGQYIATASGPYRKTWIGGTYSNGNWTWTDQTKFDFTDWDQGYPKINGTVCAFMNSQNGTWATSVCDEWRDFLPLCQYSTINCSGGWTYFSPSNSCFFSNPEIFVNNWSQAENFCKDMNSHLPSIHSNEEFQFLTNLSHQYYGPIWTGIYSPDGGRSWREADESTSDFLNYGKWCSGASYPDPSKGQKCVAVANRNGTDCYLDFDCLNTSFYTTCKKSFN